MKVIKNGVVFANGIFQDKVDVILHEGKILGFAHCLDSFDGEVINAERGYVLPGLIDIHTHGIHGHDTMEGTQEALLDMAKNYAKYGITSFLPTTVTASAIDVNQSVAAISNLSMKHTGGSVILGCHLEGPFIRPEYRGAHSLDYIAHCGLDYHHQMVGVLEKEVRLVTLSPEEKGAESLIRYLKGRGIAISCGHSGATYEEMERAIEWGVSHVTHLFNGMVSLHHREPGVIGSALNHPEVTVEMIADLIHLHPAILQLVVKAKGFDKCVLVSDSMAATGLGDGEYNLGVQKVFVKNGQARLKEGNLAGSTLTLDRAVRNMIEVVGIPPEQVIPMATSNPAKVIGEDHRRGKIARGYEGDICIMDREWNVIKTLVGGQSLYSPI
jgi:N-acetylglucosamine-6-phosphate deacetylase